MYGKIDFTTRKEPGKESRVYTGEIRNEFLVDGNTYYHVIIPIEGEEDCIYTVRPNQIIKYYNMGVGVSIPPHMINEKRTIKEGENFYIYNYRDQLVFCGNMNSIEWSEWPDEATLYNKDNVNVIMTLLEAAAKIDFLEVRQMEVTE